MAEPTTAAELRAKEAPPPVDPNVKIPKAVLDAGLRAEAIQRATNGEAEPSVASVATASNGEAPPAPAPEPAPEPTHKLTVSPAPPVAPQPQAPQEPAPQEPAPPVDWERNFRAMKGRYDTLAADMAAMGERLTNLQNENAALRANAAPPPAPNGHAPTLLTEQEIQEYGPEFIDIVRRAATEIAAPLQQEVQQLRSQLGTVQAETGNSFLTRMNATIGGLVPNWEALNRDPRFVQWSGLPEVYSGVIRRELMQEAWNSGDAHRVAAFFRAFLAEEAAVDPQAAATRGPSGFPASLAPAAQMPPPVPPAVQQPTMSLADFAAPGRAHSVAQQPADKPVYTAQDITRFYTEAASGKWRGREAEKAAIDADIILAQREGRIIPDQRTSHLMDFRGGR